MPCSPVCSQNASIKTRDSLESCKDERCSASLATSRHNSVFTADKNQPSHRQLLQSTRESLTKIAFEVTPVPLAANGNDTQSIKKRGVPHESAAGQGLGSMQKVIFLAAAARPAPASDNWCRLNRRTRTEQSECWGENALGAAQLRTHVRWLNDRLRTCVRSRKCTRRRTFSAFRSARLFPARSWRTSPVRRKWRKS